MKKLLLILTLLAGFASAQVITLNQAGITNVVVDDPTITAAGRQFFRTVSIVDSLGDYGTELCGKMDFENGKMYYWASCSARNAGDTSASILAVTGLFSGGYGVPKQYNFRTKNNSHISGNLQIIPNSSLLIVGNQNITLVTLNVSAGIVAAMISDSLDQFRDGSMSLTLNDLTVNGLLKVPNMAAGVYLQVSPDESGTIIEAPILGAGALVLRSVIDSLHNATGSIDVATVQTAGGGVQIGNDIIINDNQLRVQSSGDPSVVINTTGIQHNLLTPGDCLYIGMDGYDASQPCGTFTAAYTQSLNVLGGTAVPGVISLQSDSVDAVTEWRNTATGNYFQIRQGTADPDIIHFEGTGVSEFTFDQLSHFLANIQVDGSFMTNMTSTPVLGTGSSGELISRGTTGNLGSVVLSDNPTFTTASTFSFATANRPAWFNGTKGIRSTSVTGTLDTLVTNKGPTFWGGMFHGRLDVDSLFAVHLFAADTSSYKPFLRADTLAVTYQLRCNYCTASRPWYIDASGNAVTGTFTGTGTTFALSASPAFTGTVSATRGSVGDAITFNSSGGKTGYFYSGTNIVAFGDVAGIGGTYDGIVVDNTNTQVRLATNGQDRVTVASNGDVTFANGVRTNGHIGQGQAPRSDIMMYMATSVSAVAGQSIGLALSPVFPAATNVYTADFQSNITGAVTNLFTAYFENPAGAGSATNNEAIHIAAQTKGTNNWAIKIDGGKFESADSVVSLAFRSANYNAGGQDATFGGTLYAAAGAASLTAQILMLDGDNAIASDGGNLTIGLGDGKTISLGQGGAGLISALGPFSAPSITASGLIGGSVDVGVCVDHTTGTLYAGTLSLGTLTCAGI